MKVANKLVVVVLALVLGTKLVHGIISAEKEMEEVHHDTPASHMSRRETIAA